jgi:two-component system sensor histidine kinase PilS (NtrC family)
LLSRARQSIQSTQKSAVNQNDTFGFSSGLAFNALHDDPWKLLGLYSIYKLALASILIFAHFSGVSPLHITTFDQGLFELAINLYLFIAIISALATYLQWPDYDVQLYGNLLIDVIALLCLIYSSDNISASLSLLLTIPLLTINLLRPGQYSLFITATCIIALLSVVSYHSRFGHSDADDMLQAGLFSLFLLVSSWLVGRWAKKANDTVALVKRRELDIANLSQLNKSILDELQSGIMVVEESGAIRHMNSSAWEILGKPSNWRSRPLKHFAPELDKHLQVWLDNICPKVISCDVKHQNSMELRTRFTQLGTKAKAMTLIYIEDMSELRERLQDAKLASLGQLTANIAHEIRNPLGAISHSAQLLSESQNLDKVDARMVQIIQSNSKRMNLTIENVLNLSRKKEPKREVIILHAWLREFLDDFILQSRLDPNQIQLFISPADCKVIFDPAHLHQIIWNLCRNALKYAHPSQPEKLRLEIQGGLPNHSRDVTLNIIDNGSGISEEKQQRLFEPFYTTSETGTGLGLFMARELCLSNGGGLDYVRMPNEGSCFRLVFTKQQ